MRFWKFTIPGMHDKVAINPVVTLIGVVCLWSLVVWSNGRFSGASRSHSSKQIWIIDTTQALEKLKGCREGLSLSFTWLSHGTKVVFFFSITVVLVKYGHIHLGHKTDKVLDSGPEKSSV
jgi:choline-glycine betaine transporter